MESKVVNMKNKCSVLIFVLLLVAMLSACSNSKDNSKAAANYPKKTIQLIVPWDAGGDTDAVNRIIAEELEDVLGQTVVVKNIPGGSGVIGAQEALNAKNDGYTLLGVHDSVAMSDLMGQADFGYFDFEPISLMTSTYNAIATNPDNPWDSMEDLAEDAKANPGEISYAASIGSISQLEPALIQTSADIEFNIVGFDGTAQRMKALVANDVALGSVSLTAGKDYMEDGRMKLLGYTGEERSDDLPDLPTLKEQGIDIVSAANRGIMAPKDTPDAIIKKLDGALEEVANRDTFKKKMDDLGTEVNYQNTANYREFLKENEKQMKESLESSNLIDE